MSSNPEPWRIPSHWCWSTFAHAAEIAQDLVDPASVPNMPHIAPNNIGVGNRQILTYATVKEDGVISPKQRFRPNQILFTKIRPYLLKSVKVDFEGVCSADMYPLWARRVIDPDYLLYWITSPDFRDVIAHSQGRSVLPKINQSDLNATPFPMPSTGEQRRIVAKIDSLAAKSKRARDQLERIPLLIAKYRQMLLRSAFRGKIVCLGDICDIQSGLALGKSRSDNDQLIELPYLRVANVQRGIIDLTVIKTLLVTPAEANRLELKYGDILMNEGGDRDKLGRGWVWEGQIERCIHQNHVFRARLKDIDFPPRYVSYYTNEIGRKYFLDEGKQTTNLASVSKSKLAAMPIPVPSPAEAWEIVRRIETSFAWIDRLAAEATSARKLIDRLDQAVLARAFRGELVPQDPADEPASLLLERIEAERADAPAAKRRGRPRASALP